MCFFEIQFPEKIAFLFEPHRCKILYGGRSGIEIVGKRIQTSFTSTA